MGLSLFFHLLTAYFSVGYQAVDEHFQILEFLSYKLGGAPAYDLPVEFAEQMRPWLQVQIYWVLTHMVQALGIQNPHLWAVIFRTFTGLLGWFSAVALAQCSLLWFGDRRTQRVAIVFIASIWYFPVLHARPSSEGLGGTAFVLGLTLLFLALVKLKNKTKNSPELTRYRNRIGMPPGSEAHSPELLPHSITEKFVGLLPLDSTWAWLIGGAFLGLSFEARFQMALMILGTLLWFVWIARTPLRNVFYTFFGFSFVFILGRFADHWGHGSWSFTPWNYFSYNLIRGEVSRFGQSPWWDIFRMSITESWPILGIVMAVLCVIGWLRFPRHVLTWSLFPFFAVHCLIAHKEYRFFFPIGNAAPPLALLSLVAKQNLKLPDFSKLWAKRSPQSPRWRPCLKYGVILFFSFLLLNNLVGLIALSFIPLARNVQYQEAVSQRLTPGKEFRIYTTDRDPFVILGNPTYFYRPKELNVVRITDLKELASVPQSARPFWFFDGAFELSDETKAALPFCERSFSTLPPWIKYLNWNQWLNRANVWALYRCD